MYILLELQLLGTASRLESSNGHSAEHAAAGGTQAVSQHPSTVAVCCGPFIEAWRNYTGGIFDIAGASACPASAHLVRH